MDEMTLTLDNPITEEQWDAITDVDFERTNEITFHTKHGKIVKFVKESVRPEQHWIPCSERFPETPIRVQVQLDNGWIITAYYDEGEWYDVPGDGEPIDGVLAWMSLPEPWRGEQDG